jgi:membrane-associated phospholipid phosphatase
MATMVSRTFFGFNVRLADVVLLGAAVVYALLAVVFHGRVDGWATMVLRIGLCVIFYLAANVLAQTVPGRFPRFFLRTASVQLMIYFVYRFSIDLIHIFFSGWFDPAVIRFEAAVVGGQPTLWLQRFVRPGLTEWLMFCYVFYVAVYPILSLILYFRHGEDTNEEYLFYVSLVVVVCTAGFMLFPVAGPVPQIGDRFTVPLRGHFFTQLSELIRTRVHRPGGAMPSIHCGAATIMWWCALRFSRPTFYALAPIVLSLYVSTVYGRFHYASDVLVGVAAAFLAMLLGNVLISAWNHNKVSVGGIARP